MSFHCAMRCGEAYRKSKVGAGWPDCISRSSSSSFSFSELKPFHVGAAGPIKRKLAPDQTVAKAIHMPEGVANLTEDATTSLEFADGLLSGGNVDIILAIPAVMF